MTQPTESDASVIAQLPINERIEWLIAREHHFALSYQSAESFLARNLYRAKHPTAVLALKCMDGRLNLALATNTPVGIIEPFRSIGGRFDLGWPYFGEVMAVEVQQMTRQGRRTLILINYHYSKGDRHRGCAGWNYDTDAARAGAIRLKRQLDEMFGAHHETVYPLVCGFETDDDALILHGQNNEMLDLSALDSEDLESLPSTLARLYPDMPHMIQQDLLPILQGNFHHIEKVRRMTRTLDIVHYEWMIAVGRGFSWLHMANQALIIGPWGPELAPPIHTAGAIVQNNMKEKRIPDDGMVLFSVAPYSELGVDRARAEQKARFLSQFGADIIRTDFPDLAKKMHIRSAVLSWQTMQMDLLDNGQA